MPAWKFPDDRQFSLETKHSGSYRVTRIIDETEEIITIEYESFLGKVISQILKEDIIVISYGVLGYGRR